MSEKENKELWEGNENSEEVQENSNEGKILTSPQEKDANLRLDLFLANELGLTRNYIQKLIHMGNVEILNLQRKLKAALKVSPEMQIVVTLPPIETLEVEPEPVSFEVAYEDSSLLVINKPSGLVVHPAPGNWHGTLVHGLLYAYPDMRKFDEEVRPGIVHRLDGGTSGLLVVARKRNVLLLLQEQFRSRSVEKKYLALCRGTPHRKTGLIDAPIGRSHRNRVMMAVTESGRPSLTEYRVLWSQKNYSLIECTLHTGRTHQIRVHLKHIGCPLVGDELYGTKECLQKTPGRIFLHAWKLTFTHPITGREMKFRAELPQELSLFLKNILSSDRAR